VPKGRVLAYLRPVASAIERGNQQAQLAELEAQSGDRRRGARDASSSSKARYRRRKSSGADRTRALLKQRAFVAASVDSAEPLLAPCPA
jgi:cobalt-zinc-cadmium efflux system membrane fusion protein